MPRQLKNKPGAERRPYTTDKTETYPVASEAKLFDFLLAAMPQRKRTTVKELLKHNQVMVNATVTTQYDMTIGEGDTVKVNLTRSFPVFYHRRVSIVYEDDDVIVINKGYGLLSMGTDNYKEETAYSILRDYLKWKNPANKLFIVHRLDRDTSGLMLFAKNIETKDSLQHNWNNMVLERKYLAVVEGNIEDNEGTVKSYLAENSAFEVYSTDNPEEGQLAVTRYKVLRRSRKGYTLLQVSLDTGRKNQIRVHMKDLGHPIAGDKKYGAHTSPIHRLALHAQSLRFVHPTTRRDMRFETPVPAAFASMVK